MKAISYLLKSEYRNFASINAHKTFLYPEDFKWLQRKHKNNS